MLALHAGEVVSETALIDAIWGESPPMAVKNSIQVYIGQWRRVLAEAECSERIERSGSGYCLTMDPEGLDVRRFERLAERGREAAADGRNSIALERFDAALGLWRGEPLQDFVDMPFQQWERVRLEPELVAVTADRMDTMLALGRGPELVASLEGLVTKHPYAERFWAQLMHALYRSGRQVEATRAFARAREALADVGLEPGPILRSMEQRVVRQDPDLDGSASPFEPVAPPEALTRLIGRDDEVERLVEIVAKEGDRLVVLTGPGGVGKSRLGTEVARRIAEAGWLPVAYVALSEITDGAVVAASVNGAFGVPD
jgi:DNA-binding SARP family transcriptional activator